MLLFISDLKQSKIRGLAKPYHLSETRATDEINSLSSYILLPTAMFTVVINATIFLPQQEGTAWLPSGRHGQSVFVVAGKLPVSGDV